MFPDDDISEPRYQGEVAIDIGFKNMGISIQEKKVLIKQWSEELEKGFTDWLDHHQWFMYIYYKFMAWRIIQLLKPTN